MRERRSLLNFGVLVVVAIGTAIFLLRKSAEAIDEIERLQDTAVFARELFEPGDQAR